MVENFAEMSTFSRLFVFAERNAHFYQERFALAQMEHSESILSLSVFLPKGFLFYLIKALLKTALEEANLQIESAKMEKDFLSIEHGMKRQFCSGIV